MIYQGNLPKKRVVLLSGIQLDARQPPKGGATLFSGLNPWERVKVGTSEPFCSFVLTICCLEIRAVKLN